MGGDLGSINNNLEHVACQEQMVSVVKVTVAEVMATLTIILSQSPSRTLSDLESLKPLEPLEKNNNAAVWKWERNQIAARTTADLRKSSL